MAIGIARIERGGLADEFQRDVMAAGLIGDHSEEMQRGGMIGRQHQHFATAALGFAALSGPKRLHCSRKHRVNRRKALTPRERNAFTLLLRRSPVLAIHYDTAMLKRAPRPASTPVA